MIHLAHLLYSESERRDVCWLMHSMTFSPPAQQPASHSVSNKGKMDLSRQRKALMAQKRSLKWTKQTFNSHNKDKVKRIRAVKKICHRGLSVKTTPQRPATEKILCCRLVTQTYNSSERKTKDKKMCKM